MARDSQAALVALNRFGFGARGAASGDFVNAASDPRGFVKAELLRPNGVLLEVPGLQSTPALGKAVFDYQFEIQQARDAAAKAAPATGDRSAGAAVAGCEKRNGETCRSTASPWTSRQRNRRPRNRRRNLPTARQWPILQPESAETLQLNAPKPPPQQLNIIQKMFRAEALARFQRAARPMSASSSGWWRSGPITSACRRQEQSRARRGPARSSARRSGPFVLGRFADMLMAVERHPAMLVYLDNQQSIGPTSRAGQNGKRGLNENLAREILELHTMGVGGGYTQADVTAFARILTGWTIAGREGRLGEPGSFVFNANAHEPGDAVLARHDVSGRRHGPGRGRARRHRPPSVHGIAHSDQAGAPFRCRRSAGDAGAAAGQGLPRPGRRSRAMAVALIDAPRSLGGAAGQVALPSRIPGGRGRALLSPMRRTPAAMLGALAALGQPLWQPPGPNGFPDTSAGWASAEGMKVRLDLAWRMARQAKDRPDPRDLLEPSSGERRRPRRGRRSPAPNRRRRGSPCC